MKSQVFILASCISLAVAAPIPPEAAARLVKRSLDGHAWKSIRTAPARLDDEQACSFGEDCLQVGETATALKFFRSLEHKSPGSRYEFRCAIAAERLGMPKLANYYFSQTTRSRDPEGELERTVACQRVGQKWKPDPEMFQLRAYLFITLCQPEAAVREMKLAIKVDPENKDLWGMCGWMEICAGHYAAAARDYEHSSLRYPANYAWALYLNGEVDAAERICAHNSTNPKHSLHTRARIALDRGQPQQALIYMNQVIKGETHNPFYYEERAEVLSRLQRNSEAQADSAKAAQLRRLPSPLPRLK